MEIIETKQGKVLVMCFVEAEHCGIKLDELQNEADIVGIDLPKENPIALLIQVDGGFVIREDLVNSMTKEEQESLWKDVNGKYDRFKRIVEVVRDAK
jgi:hypothetical protein